MPTKKNGDLAEIRKRVEVINREIGEVVGELKGVRGEITTLKWLVGGTFLAAAATFVARVFGVP